MRLTICYIAISKYQILLSNYIYLSYYRDQKDYSSDEIGVKVQGSPLPDDVAVGEAVREAEDGGEDHPQLQGRGVDITQVLGTQSIL